MATLRSRQTSGNFRQFPVLIAIRIQEIRPAQALWRFARGGKVARQRDAVEDMDSTVRAGEIAATHSALDGLVRLPETSDD